MNKKIIIIAIVAILAVGSIFVFNKNSLENKSIDTQNNIVSDKKNDMSSGEAAKNFGPKIEVDQKSYDLGIVKYGDVARHTFKIKNAGTKNLEILKLSTSCGCTKASIVDEDKIILPGKSVDMLVTFDPAVHKDDTDLGILKRIVYIRTNDSENKEVEVEITANVLKQ